MTGSGKKQPRVKGYSLRRKPVDGPVSSYYFDIGDTRVIGDVVVETRGAHLLSRPGDIARSLSGTRIHR